MYALPNSMATPELLNTWIHNSEKLANEKPCSAGESDYQASQQLLLSLHVSCARAIKRHQSRKASFMRESTSTNILILLLTCWHEVMLQLASTCSVYFALFCILVKELPYAQGVRMAPGASDASREFITKPSSMIVSFGFNGLGVEFAHISPTCLSPSLPSWRWCRVDQCRRSIAKNHKP